MVAQNRQFMPPGTEVNSENWGDVLGKLQERPGFSDSLWLDEVEVDVGKLGPIAVAIEGGAVQDVVTDDKRLHGLDVLVIDYDIDGAEMTCNVTQRDHTGKDCGISEAIVSDHAVGPASGIDLAGLWHAFAHADDGLDEDD
jgi:hypothetical protein